MNQAVCLYVCNIQPAIQAFERFFDARLESDLHKAAAEMLLDTKRLFPNVSDCFNFSGRPLWLVSDWWPM